MRLTRGLVFGMVVCLGVVVPVTPAAAACGDAPSSGVDWSGCDRSFAQLNAVDLSRANLSDVDLSYAALFQTNLSGANLRRANFHDAFPVGANLSNADATGADFSHADLVAANLRGAVLRGADLSRADLDFAQLAGADLRGARFDDADFTGVTGAEQATFLSAPTSQGDVGVVLAGSSTTLDLLANDDAENANPDAALSVAVATPPAHGSFDPASGVYRPSAGWSGIDSFTYRPVATLTGVNLPAGANSSVQGTESRVTVRTIRRVTVGAPWAGRTGAEGEIVRLYVAVFNRLPDQSGFEFWVGRRQAGLSLVDIAAFFLDSGEFVGFGDSIDNATFVEFTYLSVLNRRPDDAGRSFWRSQLDAGYGRARMVATMAEADEFRTLTQTG